MNEEIEKPTLLFTILLLFSLIATISTYMVLLPDNVEIETGHIILFPHPENAG